MITNLNKSITFAISNQEYTELQTQPKQPQMLL
jgi:hypothetical protein